MANYFEKCMVCVPPERYPGCQDHCPHYTEGKAKLEADKAKVAKKNAGWDYVNDAIKDKRNATAMRRKQGRNYNKTRYM